MDLRLKFNIVSGLVNDEQVYEATDSTQIAINNGFILIIKG